MTRAPSYLDEHHAIVGATGSGKTVTAKGEVEQLLRQRRHLCIIDPTDAWYGLRSNLAGDGPSGFDIPIFGGRHSDGGLVISPRDGDAIARLIIEERISAIVSLHHLHDEDDQRAFLAPFVKRLRAKPRGNFHLIVDEADEVCPQTAPDALAFSLTRDMTWIAKRGRLHGFVLTVITQRPADIAKSVLSQATTIIAHQLVAPQDLTAIDAYLKAKGDKQVRAQVMGSLPSLDRGERWLYSPRIGLLERGRSPALTTFDSSRTPAPGEDFVEPKTLGQIDMSAIAAALKRATASSDAPIGGGADPVQQKGARLRELELEVAAAKGQAARLATAIESFNDKMTAIWDRWSAPVNAIMDAQNELFGTMAEAGLRPIGRPDSIGDMTIFDFTAADREEGASPAPSRDAGEGGAPASGKRQRERASPTSSPPGGGDGIRGRKALAVLAIRNRGLTERQWAWIGGFSRKGGTWGTYKSALVRAGLVEERAGKWFLSDAGYAVEGLEELGPFPALGPELARFWGSKISGVRRMVDALVDRWPDWTIRANLADALNMAADGGTFGTYLSRLRSAGLVEVQGKKIRLHPELMGEA